MRSLRRETSGISLHRRWRRDSITSSTKCCWSLDVHPVSSMGCRIISIFSSFKIHHGRWQKLWRKSRVGHHYGLIKIILGSRSLRGKPDTQRLQSASLRCNVSSSTSVIRRNIIWKKISKRNTDILLSCTVYCQWLPNSIPSLFQPVGSINS